VVVPEENGKWVFFFFFSFLVLNVPYSPLFFFPAGEFSPFFFAHMYTRNRATLFLFTEKDFIFPKDRPRSFFPPCVRVLSAHFPSRGFNSYPPAFHAGKINTLFSLTAWRGLVFPLLPRKSTPFLTFLVINEIPFLRHRHRVP